MSITADFKLSLIQRAIVLFVAAEEGFCVIMKRLESDLISLVVRIYWLSVLNTYWFISMEGLYKKLR